LPGAFYRAPDKDFAESKPGPRQRKVAITVPAPSTLALLGAMSEALGKDFLIFFPNFLCRLRAGEAPGKPSYIYVSFSWWQDYPKFI
jgi:hypothetical protein